MNFRSFCFDEHATHSKLKTPVPDLHVPAVATELSLHPPLLSCPAEAEEPRCVQFAGTRQRRAHPHSDPPLSSPFRFCGGRTCEI